MATDESHVVSERQKLLLDGGDQGCVVAIRKVGSSHRSAEQHVSHLCEPRRLFYEDHVTRRMAGTMQDVEPVGTQGQALALAQIPVGRAIPHSRQPVHRSLPHDAMQ